MHNTPLRTVCALLAILFLAACRTTTVVDDWAAPTQAPPPDRLAVIVMAPEALQRAAAERDVAAALSRAGVNAVASSEIRGMRGRLTREKAEAALKADGVDAALVSFLVGARRGEPLERSDYWLNYEGTGIYQGWFSSGFTNVYSVQQGPGFADFQMDIYIETTYIDLDTGQPSWNIVTRSTDPQFRDTAGAVSGRIVRQLRSSGQL